GYPVECPQVRHNLGHFLSVCSNVLHRRSTDGSGDAAQTLDSGEITVNTELHQTVPFLARANTNDCLVTIVVPLDTHQGDFQHQPGKPLIGKEIVGPAAKYENRKVLTCREIECFEYGGLGRSIDEITCRPANTEGGQGSQRHVFLDSCFHSR